MYINRSKIVVVAPATEDRHRHRHRHWNALANIIGCIY
jgi:hypothetical protein